VWIVDVNGQDHAAWATVFQWLLKLLLFFGPQKPLFFPPFLFFSSFFVSPICAGFVSKEGAFAPCERFYIAI